MFEVERVQFTQRLLLEIILLYVRHANVGI